MSSRGAGECVRCWRWRWIKARRLCERCYDELRESGDLDRYPKLPVGPRMDVGVYCCCAVYVPQRIALFNAEQCATCGRTRRPVAA